MDESSVRQIIDQRFSNMEDSIEEIQSDHGKLIKLEGKFADLFEELAELSEKTANLKGGDNQNSDELKEEQSSLSVEQTALSEKLTTLQKQLDYETEARKENKKLMLSLIDKVNDLQTDEPPPPPPSEDFPQGTNELHSMFTALAERLKICL